MALSTYDELQDAIADYLDDDLASQIQDFIRLAEARHRREIRIREMVQRESITVDARYLDFPAGFLEARGFRLLTSPATALSQLSPDEMTLRRRETTGKPEYFTFHSQIELDVTPDSAYSGELLYHKALTPLSTENTSNALLEIAPDAYLYGALSASAPFLLNDERLQVWEALYGNARDALNFTARQSRRAGSPLVARVRGATP